MIDISGKKLAGLARGVAMFKSVLNADARMVEAQDSPLTNAKVICSLCNHATASTFSVTLGRLCSETGCNCTDPVHTANELENSKKFKVGDRVKLSPEKLARSLWRGEDMTFKVIDVYEGDSRFDYQVQSEEANKGSSQVKESEIELENAIKENLYNGSIDKCRWCKHSKEDHKHGECDECRDAQTDPGTEPCSRYEPASKKNVDKSDTWISAHGSQVGDRASAQSLADRTGSSVQLHAWSEKDKGYRPWRDGAENTPLEVLQPSKKNALTNSSCCVCGNEEDHTVCANPKCSNTLCDDCKNDYKQGGKQFCPDCQKHPKKNANHTAVERAWDTKMCRKCGKAVPNTWVDTSAWGNAQDGGLCEKCWWPEAKNTDTQEQRCTTCNHFSKYHSGALGCSGVSPAGDRCGCIMDQLIVKNAGSGNACLCGHFLREHDDAGNCNFAATCGCPYLRIDYYRNAGRQPSGKCICGHQQANHENNGDRVYGNVTNCLQCRCAAFKDEASGERQIGGAGLNASGGTFIVKMVESGWKAVITEADGSTNTIMGSTRDEVTARAKELGAMLAAKKNASDADLHEQLQQIKAEISKLDAMGAQRSTADQSRLEKLQITKAGLEKALKESDPSLGNAGVVHFTFGSGTERQAACGAYVAFGDKHAALRDVTCKACLEDLSGEKQNTGPGKPMSELRDKLSMRIYGKRYAELPDDGEEQDHVMAEFEKWEKQGFGNAIEYPHDILPNSKTGLKKGSSKYGSLSNVNDCRKCEEPPYKSRRLAEGDTVKINGNAAMSTGRKGKVVIPEGLGGMVYVQLNGASTDVGFHPCCVDKV